jgi:hypothetical protein
MSDVQKGTGAPCPRSPLRPLEFAVDCPACERTMLLEACEWEQEPSGAYAAHGPERWPVCGYCKTQFEVEAVQVVPVGENSPSLDDGALDAELAADPAIAASLSEWERTSGPPPGENSPDLRMRAPAEMVVGLKALAAHLSSLDSGSPEAGLMRDAALYIAGATDSLREHMAEVGRLRAIIRVNALRAGATDAEIDEVIHGKR